MKEKLIRSAILVVVLSLYGPTLWNGYAADDLGQVRDNVWIRNLSSIPHALTSCIWESANRGCYGRSYYYRPLHVVSYIFTYQISSKPWAFHAVQLLYFSLSGYLIYRLAKELTGNTAAAGIAALLVLIHPINSEVAGWISATPEAMLALFSLLTTLAYLRYKNAPTPQRLWAVYGLYGLAVLGKEPAVLIPAVLVTIDVLWFKQTPRGLATLPTIKQYAPFAGIFLAYVLMRQAVLGIGIASKFGDFTALERINALVRFLGEYLIKTLWPWPLNYFHLFTKSNSLTSSEFLWSAVVVVLFFAGIAWSIKKKQRLWTFGFIWFSVFLAPVLIYLGGVGTNILSERYLFVPLIGLAIPVGSVLSAWLQDKKQRTVAVILLAGILFASAVTIWQRNSDWKDNITLFSKTLTQSPDAHELRRALAETYFVQGDGEKAKTEYEWILNRNPKWEDITMVYKGLGDYYYQVAHNVPLATSMYEKAAASARPTARDYVTFSNLGIAYSDQDKPMPALLAFCRAQALLPDDSNSAAHFESALKKVKELPGNELITQLQETLRPASASPITFQATQCDDATKQCQYRFSYTPQTSDILLPWLITGISKKSEIFATLDPTLGPDTAMPGLGIITVTADQKWQKQAVDFLFPSCSGIYYTVSANA